MLREFDIVGDDYANAGRVSASIKAMLRSVDCARLAERMDEWLATRSGSLRADLHSFAEGDSIEL